MNDERTERAAQGVEHLQTAAREMIEAARAFLDVIEDFVSDPNRMASVAEAVGSVAKGAARSMGADHEDRDDDPGDSVQHIRVS